MDTAGVIERTRPLYSEFQGYLSQAPASGYFPSPVFESLRKSLEETIDELNIATGKDYNRFKLLNTESREVSVYRSKISGLISRLYGTYFSFESPPLSGHPQTIINQHQIQKQNQSQASIIGVILDVRDKIDEKLITVEDPQERSFLEKIRDGLREVHNVLELIQLIVTAAKATNLTLDKITSFFS